MWGKVRVTREREKVKDRELNRVVESVNSITKDAAVDIVKCGRYSQHAKNCKGANANITRKECSKNGDKGCRRKLNKNSNSPQGRNIRYV